jgi:hypothetical protein
LCGLVILALTAASAEVYDAVAEKDGISGLDRPALDKVIAWRTPLANSFLTGFTHLGGALGMTPDRRRHHAIDGLAAAFPLLAAASELTTDGRVRPGR